MFVRKVSVRLKPESLTEFAHLMDQEILPWLRKQEGFLDLIILAGTDSMEVATLSFWEHKGNADAYNASGYPKALRVLEELLDGKPYVKTFEVVSSTLHRVIVLPPRQLGTLTGDTDGAGGGGSYETSV